MTTVIEAVIILAIIVSAIVVTTVVLTTRALSRALFRARSPTLGRGVGGDCALWMKSDYYGVDHCRTECDDSVPERAQ